MKNTDGIIIQRPHLARILGLEHFKRARVGWLVEDMKSFFPSIKPTWSRSPKTFSSIYVSRIPLDSFFKKGPMPDRKRIELMAQGGVRIGFSSMWSAPKAKEIANSFKNMMPFLADLATYDEKVLSAYLALLSQGQISPKKLMKICDGA